MRSNHLTGLAELTELTELEHTLQDQATAAALYSHPEYQTINISMSPELAAEVACGIVELRLFKDAIKRLYDSSERAPDVRAVEMRLVHEAVFDELARLARLRG